MDGGTDPLVLLAVGGVGVLGTLAGAFVNDWLTRRREDRGKKARQRRAVTAVVGELLDAVSIIDLAMRRGAWWPPRDAPRHRAWDGYSDDMAEVLDDEGWHRLRMTYETLRSLDAMRDDPDHPAKRRESPYQDGAWDARWKRAPASAQDAWQAVWAALEFLRPFHIGLARPEDRAQMEAQQHSPPEPPPELP